MSMLLPPREPSRAAMMRFVKEMQDLYVEEYRQFLREAAEVAIEEAVERVRTKLNTQAHSEYSCMHMAPLVTVLFEMHGEKPTTEIR